MRWVCTNKDGAVDNQADMVNLMMRLTKYQTGANSMSKMLFSSALETLTFIVTFCHFNSISIIPGRR